MGITSNILSPIKLYEIRQAAFHALSDKIRERSLHLFDNTVSSAVELDHHRALCGSIQRPSIYPGESQDDRYAHGINRSVQRMRRTRDRSAWRALIDTFKTSPAWHMLRQILVYPRKRTNCTVNINRKLLHTVRVTLPAITLWYSLIPAFADLSQNLHIL